MSLLWTKDHAPSEKAHLRQVGDNGRFQPAPESERALYQKMASLQPREAGTPLNRAPDLELHDIDLTPASVNKCETVFPGPR